MIFASRRRDGSCEGLQSVFPVRSVHGGDLSCEPSSRPRQFECLEQLQHVVRRRDQRRFAADLSQSTQKKLPEPPRVLDLPEHRLHDRLAPCIGLSAAHRRQHSRHALSQRQFLRRSPPRRHPSRFSMLLTPRRNERLDPLRLESLHILFRSVSRVGEDRPRPSPQCLLDRVHRRLQLLRIRSVRGHVLGHDHLPFCVRRLISIHPNVAVLDG